jgi:hypothetical protein
MQATPRRASTIATDGGALDFAFLPGYAAFDPMITFEYRAAAKFPRVISSRSYVSFRRQ